MDEAIRAFVRYLELERGASRETIRSYRSDLRQFVSFITTFNDPQFQPTTPTSIDSLTIRRYLRWLDEKKEKKSSLARKLATLKSFYRFLTKEGWDRSQPGGPSSISTSRPTIAESPDQRRGQCLDGNSRRSWRHCHS